MTNSSLVLTEQEVVTLPEPTELYIHNKLTGECLAIDMPLLSSSEHVHFDKNMLSLRVLPPAGKGWRQVRAPWRVQYDDYYKPGALALRLGMFTEEL